MLELPGTRRACRMELGGRPHEGEANDVARSDRLRVRAARARYKDARVRPASTNVAGFRADRLRELREHRACRRSEDCADGCLARIPGRWKRRVRRTRLAGQMRRLHRADERWIEYDARQRVSTCEYFERCVLRILSAAGRTVCREPHELAEPASAGRVVELKQEHRAPVRTRKHELTPPCEAEVLRI